MAQPQPNFLTIDNKPVHQTGQPHLQRIITPQRPPSAYATIPQAPPAPAPAPVQAAAPPPVMAPPPAPVMEAAAPVMAEMAAPEPIAAPEAPAVELVAEPAPVMAAPTPVELPLAPVEPVMAAAPRIDPEMRRPMPAVKPMPVAAKPPETPRAPTVATKGPSLFQKMTGLIGGSRPATGSETAAEMPRVVEPVPPQRPAATITAIQPPLSGLDGNRPKATREEDDLQIPAFLRRQAN
jgi:hypothetical protein